MEPSRHRLTGWWGWGVQGALPLSLLLQSTATGNANGHLKEFKKEGKRRGYGGMSQAVCVRWGVPVPFSPAFCTFWTAGLLSFTEQDERSVTDVAELA